MKIKKKKILIKNSFFSKLYDKLFPINRSIIGQGYNDLKNTI